jgi:hypothetical protein
MVAEVVAEVVAVAAAAAAAVVMARTFAVDDGLQRQARPNVLADLLPLGQRAPREEAEPAVRGRDEAPVIQPEGRCSEHRCAAARHLHLRADGARRA